MPNTTTINEATNSICPYPFTPPPPLTQQTVSFASQCNLTYAQAYGQAYITVQAVTLSYFCCCLVYMLWRLYYGIRTKRTISKGKHLPITDILMASLYDILVAMACLALIIGCCDLYGYANILTPCGFTMSEGTALSLLLIVIWSKSNDFSRMVHDGRNTPNLMSTSTRLVIISLVSFTAVDVNRFWGHCVMNRQYFLIASYIECSSISIIVLFITIYMFINVFAVERVTHPPIVSQQRSSAAMLRTEKIMALMWAKAITGLLLALVWYSYATFFLITASAIDEFDDSDEVITLWGTRILLMFGVALFILNQGRKRSSDDNGWWLNWLTRVVVRARRSWYRVHALQEETMVVTTVVAPLPPPPPAVDLSSNTKNEEQQSYNVNDTHE